MHYNSVNLINPGSGGAGDLVFTCNDLYDPIRNVGALEGQPRGFDQYMALFNHFTVIGSKIKITCINTSTAALMIGITVLGGPNPVTNIEELTESRLCKMISLPGIPTAGGTTTRSLTHKINPNTFLDIPSPLSNPDVKGTAGSSPAEVCYYHCFAYSQTLGDPAPVPYDITIEYTCILTEPKVPPAST